MPSRMRDNHHTQPIIGRGTGSKAHSHALRELNTELMKHFKDGRRAYFNKDDARYAYAKWNGRCAFCGKGLIAHGSKRDSCKLMLRVPLKMDGWIGRDNLLPVCKDCRETQCPDPKFGKLKIPNVDTIADIIDRLIVEVHKLAFFENKKREEHAKENPDVEKIAAWDNSSRDCCEIRSMLKRRLNASITEFVYSMQYKPQEEARTFRPPEIIEDKNTFADVVADMCLKSAENEDPLEDPDLEKGKDQIKEILTGIHSIHDYRVLRNPNEDK